MEADFSGYATKTGLKCSDGRTIMPDAFKHHDGMRVPLVWQHGHNEPANVLGHVLLENRTDGVYAYGYFNDTESGRGAKTLVQHEDITAMSIYANKLVEKAKNVLHGAIREVSLVLSGANPGALIDHVNLAHSDGEVETLEDEAIIYTGLTLEHESKSDAAPAADEKTVQDVYNAFSEEQKNVVHFMIGAALEAADENVEHSDDESDDVESDDDESDEATHSDDAESEEDNQSEDAVSDDENPEGDLNHQEGTEMTHNVFEDGGSTAPQATLSHDQLKAIFDDGKKLGSFKESFLQHAVEYGIENIDYLFPDARALSNSPELITRKQEWVAGVMAGTKKSPFSRIKTVSADVTLEDARAKGYVKGNMKKEEFFALAKRTTTPSTVYKKQKLDRDDIIDITDLDVVAWLKAEMRIMLEEELARAVLVGDGREIDDDDKIDESTIRPIAYDSDFFADKTVIAANLTGDAVTEAIVRARPNYRGSGNPTFYCTEGLLTDLLLVKDKMGRRLYANEAELAFTLRVRNIVTVPVMETLTTDGGDLIGVVVNLNDYTMGADKGGNIAFFDDFDIDYNQYKYLIETRMSGALTVFKSALVISRENGTQVTPTVPTFVPATGVVTIPDVTGVTYFQDEVEATAGAQTAVAAGEDTEVVAVPDTGYYFPHNFDADWMFTRDL